VNQNRVAHAIIAKVINHRICRTYASHHGIAIW